MSFFNALVREFFSQDPFNAMPLAVAAPQPARPVPTVRMTQMTQMMEGLMLNGGTDGPPTITVHRTSRSMHNLNNERPKAAKITDAPRSRFREISHSTNTDRSRMIELDSSGGSSQLKAITHQNGEIAKSSASCDHNSRRSSSVCEGQWKKSLRRERRKPKFILLRSIYS